MWAIHFFNWLTGRYFFTCKKIQIYLSSYGKKCSLSVNITSYTPLSDSIVTHQVLWASFLTLITDFTWELQPCSPAAAAISLLFGCSHILLFSIEQATCAWHAEADNEWGTSLSPSTQCFADTWYWALFFAHLNPGEWYYCRWVRISMLKCKVRITMLKYYPIQSYFTAV